MAITLPSEKIKPTRLNPKVIIIYGLPKCGKTSSLITLPDCLILDLEGGAEMYESFRIPITKTSDFDDVCKQLAERANEIKAKEGKGRYPFNYIAIDTLDKLEDLVDVEQTALYKRKTANTKDPFTGISISELPYGAGYGMIREGFKNRIDQLSKVCKHLILVSHVKDKYLGEKNGNEVTEKDLALSGKLGGIISAKADAIGYMSRSFDDKLKISFKSSGNTIRGARFDHLAGKEFDFAWDRVFLPNNTSADTAETP